MNPSFGHGATATAAADGSRTATAAIAAVIAAARCKGSC